MPRTLHFEVLPEEAGRKLGGFLRSHGVSARLLTSLKTQPMGICRNGRHARSIDRIEAGDVLTLHLPEDTAIPAALPFPLEIIFEDSDLLVINKPAGLAMHPTHNHQGDTLANAVAAYLSQKGEAAAFRATGRLDKGTSGLTLCAKHAFAAANLSKGTEKTYYALALGCYTGEGSFRNAIFRPFPNRTLRACRAAGEAPQSGDEAAVTHWQALRRRDGITLLKIWLETGRTHQIRVHFAHNGTPLVGDDYYGAPPRPEARHFLHCGVLRFVHPVTGKALCLEVPLPPEMAALAGRL
ncbi:MAG: RluA family pseudouridine synthase [Oscillospiraceae bacterium]|jgi:23S rRNA pseudouridine1911/1915/1917 synthase|nr:RluA family pseudouridine synthase [Oscillospiraceae bacterium]